MGISSNFQHKGFMKHLRRAEVNTSFAKHFNPLFKERSFRLWSALASFLFCAWSYFHFWAWFCFLFCAWFWCHFARICEWPCRNLLLRLPSFHTIFFNQSYWALTFWSARLRFGLCIVKTFILFSVVKKINLVITIHSPPLCDRCHDILQQRTSKLLPISGSMQKDWILTNALEWI